MNPIDLDAVIFGNVKVEPNVEFLNGCYINLLVFLKSIGGQVGLPEKLDWTHDRLNPESFIYLDEYSIQWNGGEAYIKGYTREHEPYFIENFKNEHYLKVDCCLPLGKAVFYFAYLEYDGEFNKGVAHIELPEVYQSDFIDRIHGFESGPIRVKD
jgi:hypothetical protein